MTSPILDQPPFTLNNLPYGIISTSDEPKGRCAVAIGEHAIDLAKYAKERLAGLELGQQFSFDQIFALPALNTFASLPWYVLPTKFLRMQLVPDMLQGHQKSASRAAPV